MGKSLSFDIAALLILALLLIVYSEKDDQRYAEPAVSGIYLL